MAQQESQRAQFIVEKAKQERQQKIVQAEGEAASAKMVSFSVTLCSFIGISDVKLKAVLAVTQSHKVKQSFVLRGCFGQFKIYISSLAR